MQSAVMNQHIEAQWQQHDSDSPILWLSDVSAESSSIDQYFSSVEALIVSAVEKTVIVIDLPPAQQDQALMALRKHPETFLSLIVTVAESQLAVFLANGRYTDVFAQSRLFYLQRLPAL